MQAKPSFWLNHTSRSIEHIEKGFFSFFLSAGHMGLYFSLHITSLDKHHSTWEGQSKISPTTFHLRRYHCQKQTSSLSLEAFVCLHRAFHSLTHFPIFIGPQSPEGAMINRSLSKCIPFYSHLLPSIHLQGCLSTSWLIWRFLALRCSRKLLKPMMDLSTLQLTLTIVMKATRRNLNMTAILITHRMLTRVWLIPRPIGGISTRPWKTSGKFFPRGVDTFRPWFCAT